MVLNKNNSHETRTGCHRMCRSRLVKSLSLRGLGGFDFRFSHALPSLTCNLCNLKFKADINFFFFVLRRYGPKARNWLQRSMTLGFCYSVLFCNIPFAELMQGFAQGKSLCFLPFCSWPFHWHWTQYMQRTATTRVIKTGRYQMRYTLDITCRRLNTFGAIFSLKSTRIYYIPNNTKNKISIPFPIFRHSSGNIPWDTKRYNYVKKNKSIILWLRHFVL